MDRTQLVREVSSTHLRAAGIRCAAVLAPGLLTRLRTLCRASARARAYDPAQHCSAPFGWLREFGDARQRLRDWVDAAGA
ncbi:hypothetical protein CLE01_23940 [Cryobacterium levicorallinum]|nr:hypothetical protein CLE01_23940 [Cryobacterium levicorallinum]